MDESGGGLDSRAGSRWNVICVFYPLEGRILKNDETHSRVDENVRKHIL